MNRVELTPYRRHVQRWGRGCGADDCSVRGTRVCLLRGEVPCDVLFVGEAPGESENVLGSPFVGPAGKLLDRVLRRADLGQLRVAFTNTVGCIPRNPQRGDKADEPTWEQMESCRPRLEDAIRVASPRLIVRVGKLAEKWLEPGMKDAPKFDPSIRLAAIVHPAAILRANVAQRGLMEQRAVVALRTAVEEL